MVKYKIFAVLLSLTMLISATGVVYCMTSVDVTNYFETGIVDIHITEHRVVDGEELDWLDNPTVVPGAMVSKIPRINNDGNDCYVRSKITFRGTEELSEDDLFGISGNWVKADDGYWYCKDVVPHGSSVDLFQGLKIPENFSQENEGSQFYIDIDVDAIQSRNFTPDFGLSSPWGSIEVLKNEKGDGYDVSTFKPSDSKSFEISYRGESATLVKNEDDFFANFPYMMPGDSYSDSVVLENDGKRDITMYFRTIDIDDSELLDKLQLKIVTTINGKTTTVYEGDLRASSMNKNTSLGTIPAGKSGEFFFEVKMPAELNNKYTIMSSQVKWVFSTELNDVEDPITKPPKTGDELSGMMTVCSVLFVLSSVGLVAVVLLARREDKKHEKVHK